MSLTGISDSIRQCLVDLDTGVARKILPGAAEMTEEALITGMHYSRTACGSLLFRERAYSHAWLTERGMPSGLPDHHRPRAQRMYPCVVPGVGISVNFSSSALRPVALEVREAMEEAVLEVHADGQLNNSVLVRSRMNEARKRVYKELMLPKAGK